MKFNMDALGHIENLSKEISELDKNQVRFERELEMHKAKMELARL